MGFQFHTFGQIVTIFELTGQTLDTFPHILILEISEYQVLILGHHFSMNLFAILVSFQECSLLILLAFFVSEAVVHSLAQCEIVWSASFIRFICFERALNTGYFSTFIYLGPSFSHLFEALTIVQLLVDTLDTALTDFFILSSKPLLASTSAQIRCSHMTLRAEPLLAQARSSPCLHLCTHITYHTFTHPWSFHFKYVNLIFVV